MTDGTDGRSDERGNWRYALLPLVAVVLLYATGLAGWLADHVLVGVLLLLAALGYAAWRLDAA